MVKKPARSKFDVVMSNLASMEYLTTFTIQTFQERLASVDLHICRSTLYNYMDFLFQAEQGIQKLKIQGEKRLYYQINGDVPLNISSTSLRRQAREKYKERGWLKATKIVVIPKDEINYSDEKRKRVANFCLKNLPRKRVSSKGRPGPKEGEGHPGSIFQTMYGILLNMEIGSTFAHKDLKSILIAMGLDIRSSILNTYLSSLYRADCGVDRVRVYDGRRIQSYYTLTAELPKNVTITFFRKLGEGSERITKAVTKHAGTSIEFKDSSMKKIWMLAEQRDQVQLDVVSEEKTEIVPHPVYDSEYTDDQLGQMLVAYMVKMELYTGELEEKIEELEENTHLQDEITTLKGKVSELEKELEIKNEQLSELKTAKQTRRMSLRQRVSNAVSKL